MQVFLLYDPSTSDVFLFGGDKVLEIQGSRLDDLRPAALYIGDMSGFALRPASCGPRYVGMVTCALRPAPYDVGSSRKIYPDQLCWSGLGETRWAASTTKPLVSCFALPLAYNPTTTPCGSKNRKSSLSPSITSKPCHFSVCSCRGIRPPY